MFALEFTGKEFALAYVKDSVRWITDFEPANISVCDGLPIGKDAKVEPRSWLEVLGKERSFIFKEKGAIYQLSPGEIFYVILARWKKHCLELLRSWKEPLSLSKQYNPFIFYLHSPVLDPITLNFLRWAATKAQWNLVYVPILPGETTEPVETTLDPLSTESERSKEVSTTESKISQPPDPIESKESIETIENRLIEDLNAYNLKPLAGNISLGHRHVASLIAREGEYPTVWVMHCRLQNQSKIPLIYGYRYRSLDNTTIDHLELPLEKDQFYTMKLVCCFTETTYAIKWYLTEASEEDFKPNSTKDSSKIKTERKQFAGVLDGKLPRIDIPQIEEWAIDKQLATLWHRMSKLKKEDEKLYDEIYAKFSTLTPKEVDQYLSQLEKVEKVEKGLK
jgi:hypothetical protein